MSSVAGTAMLLVLLLSVGAAVLLYLFVTAEHDARETMDRETAEQAARRDHQEPETEPETDQS